jgi:hypothetical protein
VKTIIDGDVCYSVLLSIEATLKLFVVIRYKSAINKITKPKSVYIH